MGVPIGRYFNLARHGENEANITDA
jgi:hypothetical protein